MKTIANTSLSARTLLASILSSGITPVFDVDGVLLNAIHRQKLYTQADLLAGKCTYDQIGQLDLNSYRAASTMQNIQQDKNMPLLYVVQELNKLGKAYHVATARVICSGSRKLFADRGIKPEVLISRQGDKDQRRDHDLKSDGFIRHFGQRQRANLVLVDDSLGNCKAAIELGLKAIHVPFEGC